MAVRRWRFALGALLALAACVGIALPRGLAAATMTVNVRTATVMGKSQQILVDAKGMTLYYLTSDTATSTACTGGCPSVWPPLLSNGTPTGPSSLPGKLAVMTTANGSQVAYNGHPLYRYAPDTKPGDVRGDGKKGPKNGTWHAGTPATRAM